MKQFLILYALFLFLFVSCKTQTCVEYVNQSSSLNYSAAVADTQMNRIMFSYSSTYNAAMNNCVGFTTEPYEKGNPEGDLGKLVSDILFDSLKKAFTNYTPQNSFVLINNGGLRIALPKGEITNGKLFELMPFENYATVVVLTGTELKNNLINYLIQKKGQPLSYNVSIRILNGKLIQFTVGGQEVMDEQHYFVITSDYLASGGDNLVFMQEKTKVEYANLKFRDVLIGYFLKHTTKENPAIVNKIQLLAIE